METRLLKVFKMNKEQTRISSIEYMLTIMVEFGGEYYRTLTRTNASKVIRTSIED